MRRSVILGVSLLAGGALTVSLLARACDGAPGRSEAKPRGTAVEHPEPGPALQAPAGSPAAIPDPSTAGPAEAVAWDVGGRVVDLGGKPVNRGSVRVRAPGSSPDPWDGARDLEPVRVGADGAFTLRVPPSIDRVSLQARDADRFGEQVVVLRATATEPVTLVLGAESGTVTVRVLEARAAGQRAPLANARVTFSVTTKAAIAVDEERWTGPGGEVALLLPRGGISVRAHTAAGGWRGRRIELGDSAKVELVLPPTDSQARLELRLPEGAPRWLDGAFQSTGIHAIAYQPVRLPTNGTPVAVTFVPGAGATVLHGRTPEASLQWDWASFSEHVDDARLRIDLSRGFHGHVRVVDQTANVAFADGPVLLKASTPEAAGADQFHVGLNLDAAGTATAVVPYGAYICTLRGLEVGTVTIDPRDVTADGALALRLPSVAAFAGTIETDDIQDLEIEATPGNCGVDPGVGPFWRRRVEKATWRMILPVPAGTPVGLRLRHAPSRAVGPCVKALPGSEGILLHGPNEGVIVSLSVLRAGRNATHGAVTLRHEDDFPEDVGRSGEGRTVLPYTYVRWAAKDGAPVAFRHVRPGRYTVALVEGAVRAGFGNLTSTRMGVLPPDALRARETLLVDHGPIRMEVEVFPP
jgi:hypothetical protein